MSSRTLSMIIIPCGAPKPRNAVLETVLVLQRCETKLDWPREANRRHRRGARDQRRLAFLAAETAAHAAAMDGDFVHAPAEGARHEVLHLGRMLRRAHHEHAAVFLRQRDRDLAFE